MRKLLGTAVLVFALSGVGAAQAADPIRIGDINSYKALPAFTIPYKQAVDLAVEQINAKGGVLGRPLEVVSRDDQGKPGEAVAYAEELDRQSVGEGKSVSVRVDLGRCSIIKT